MTETKKSIKIDLNSPDVTSTDNESQTVTQLNHSTEPSSEGERKEGKFYLPALGLNNKDMWKPLQSSDRKHWTDEKAFSTCVGNCCDIKGLKAGCCHLDMNDLEHVLGPVDDDDIKLILQKLRKRGISATREDVVIDFEEGKLIGEAFFNGHEVFNNKKSYPFLRFQVSGPRFVCKYLSTKTGMCTIYEFRPKMCRDYLCQFVQTRFLVRNKDKPNTFVKLR